MRSIALLVLIFHLVPCFVTGQTVRMYDLERKILQVVAQDTVSPALSYMPVGRRFGIAELSDTDQLVIAKTRRYVHLISRNTGFVYVPKASDGSLFRLDSSNVFGLEYQVDPFIRKDSLFMIATSRFLKGKGFLAYFEPSLLDWKAYRGNDAVLKESTRPLYDPVKDELFLVCNYTYQEGADTASASDDNVLCYSFARSKWSLIGKLDTALYNSAISVPVEFNWATSFGAGNFEEGDLNVVQPTYNRWISTDSVFRAKLLRDVPAMAEPGKLLQLIHMGDTLYAFSGSVDSVRVDRIPVRESDFTVMGGKALFEEMEDIELGKEEGGEGTKGFPNWALILIGVAVASVAYAWYQRRGADAVQNGPSVADGEQDPSGPGQDLSTLSSGAKAVKQPVHYFLESLTPVEKSLVLELARYTSRGDMMDTQSLNQILGVSQKEPEVQKVRRSLTITRINSNFSQMVAPDSALIKREKDPSDKRVFQYHLTKEDAVALLAAAEVQARN